MGIGAWENQSPREFLLIATPHTGVVSYEWAIHFKILGSPIPFNVVSNRGLPIDRARNELVEQAYKLNATHIFFMDSDIILPPDAINRLYSHNLPIVSGIYGSKHESPGIWIEQSANGQQRYAALMPQVLEQPQLFTHPKMVVGMGCCLIRMEVFNTIKNPWFKWTQGQDPQGVSEDFYFCEQIRDRFPIYVDTSVRAEHIDWSKLNWKGERTRLMI